MESMEPFWGNQCHWFYLFAKESGALCKSKEPTF